MLDILTFIVQLCGVILTIIVTGEMVFILGALSYMLWMMIND